MSKIVYLFGAGASANVLPVVNDIPRRLFEFKDFIQGERKSIPNDGPLNIEKLRDSPKPGDMLDELIDDVNWLYRAVVNHASIDTYAKKLYIIGDKENLYRLKRVLTVYFFYAQYNKIPDDRYDSFFASLINQKNVLPDRVRILSWNYDYQFERSFSEFSQDDSLFANQHLLNVILKKNYRMLIDEDWNKFFIVKLNGSAQLPFSHQEYYDSSIKFSDNLKKGLIWKIVSYYATAKYSTKSSIEVSNISFAWEEKEIRNDFVQWIVKSTRDASILVVVGYSFPFFNREIDRKLFQSLKLDKVYIQDLTPNIPKERWQALGNEINTNNIILLKECEQFYLPNEL